MSIHTDFNHTMKSVRALPPGRQDVVLSHGGISGNGDVLVIDAPCQVENIAGGPCRVAALDSIGARGHPLTLNEGQSATITQPAELWPASLGSRVAVTRLEADSETDALVRRLDARIAEYERRVAALPARAEARKRPTTRPWDGWKPDRDKAAVPGMRGVFARLNKHGEISSYQAVAGGETRGRFRTVEDAVAWRDAKAAERGRVKEAA